MNFQTLFHYFFATALTLHCLRAEEGQDPGLQQDKFVAFTLEEGFRYMFNGKDLTGWQTTGNWAVKKGRVVTLEPRLGEKGWTRYSDYITTTRKYKNFELKLDFKFNKRGNSGVFMRVGDVKDHVNSGFEVQILTPMARRSSVITIVVVSSER